MTSTSAKLGVMILSFHNLISFSFPVRAEVNMKNASFYHSWKDDLGSNKKHNIIRTYNSRSLERGLFGFGWCSKFEEKLRHISAQHIVISTCHGDEHYIALSNLNSPTQFRNSKNQEDRIDVINGAYHVITKSPIGQFQLGQLRLAQSQTGKFRRRNFDRNGNLTFYSDPSDSGAASFAIQYTAANIPKTLQFSDGDTFNILTDSLTGRIQSIRSLDGTHVLRYLYTSSDLTAVRSHGRTGTIYQYDEAHNLVHAEGDEGSITMTYDQDHDWITSYRDSKACQETFSYMSSSDTDVSSIPTHLSARGIRRCNTRIVHDLVYDFFYEQGPHGNAILRRATVQSVQPAQSPARLEFNLKTGRIQKLINERT